VARFFLTLTPCAWRIFKQGELVPARPGSKDIFMGPALPAPAADDSQTLMIFSSYLAKNNNSFNSGDRQTSFSPQ
jgi:hypothetical protein